MSPTTSLHTPSPPSSTATASSDLPISEKPILNAPPAHRHPSPYLRDSIIGFSDGITVPFALTAGLSSLGQSRIVILGGLAELFAGAISMGLGAFLAAITEKKQYAVAERRVLGEGFRETEVLGVLGQYGVEAHEGEGVVRALRGRREMWVQFIMDFSLHLSNPTLKTASLEGLVMGISYFVGGLLPLIPYFICTHDVNKALFISVGVTAAVLLVFGFGKAKLTGNGGRDALFGAVQTLACGGVAAAVAYGIVRGVNSAGVV